MLILLYGQDTCPVSLRQLRSLSVGHTMDVLLKNRSEIPLKLLLSALKCLEFATSLWPRAKTDLLRGTC